MITNANENTDTSPRTNMLSRISFDQFLRHPKSHTHFTGRVKCWIYGTNMHESISKTVNFMLYLICFFLLALYHFLCAMYLYRSLAQAWKMLTFLQ